MTRDESLQGYVVAGGVIRSPGKFEGGALWGPFYYAAMLDGGADTELGDEWAFQIGAEDRAIWPELPAGKTWIVQREDTSGHVRSELWEERPW